MTKIQQIEHAIAQAELEQSKLSAEVLALAGMNSAKVRHLLNNLGAISTKYLEVGTWRGASFCSTMFGNNHLVAMANDDWHEFNEDGTVADIFLNNVKRLLSPKEKIHVDIGSCWHIGALPFEPDLFFFDGSHDTESHQKAVTHFFPMMADSFVFAVDDFGANESGFRHVQIATREALEWVKDEYEVEAEWNLLKENGYWEGLGIFLIKRK